jgi:CIC family chloride channel protein
MKREEEDKPKEVLHEEALVSVSYSVLIPVADYGQAKYLGQLGSRLAREHDGELLALHVVRVPPQMGLNDGRLFLRERRPYIDEVIKQAREYDVPVHSMIRLGRSVTDAILKTISENASDLVLFGWPGQSGSRGVFLGSVMDRIVANPPSDVAILRHRDYGELRSILVPVAGGPNGRLAVSLAIALARNTRNALTKVTLINVAVGGIDPSVTEARAKNAFRRASEGLEYHSIETRIVSATDPLDGILNAARDFDMVVLGATQARFFRNVLIDNVAEQVANQAECPVIIVKRRSTMIESVLRQTVLNTYGSARN